MAEPPDVYEVMALYGSPDTGRAFWECRRGAQGGCGRVYSFPAFLTGLRCPRCRLFLAELIDGDEGG